MARYGVGILGAGLVAGEYVKAFRDHPATDVIGVHSPTPGRGSSLLRAHGVEAVDFRSAEELLSDERVQIVVSLTPPAVRPSQVIAAAERGCHVVIEKPVALTLGQVGRMQRAIADAGVKSITSFVLRWNPMIQTLARIIHEGRLGELVYAEADYWNPSEAWSLPKPWYITKSGARSAFVEGGCHAVDVLRFLVGEIAEVAAFSTGARRNMNIEFDPVAVASLRFENGAVGKVSTLLDADAPYEFNVRLFGTDGSAQNNRVYSSSHYPGALGYWEFPTIRPDSEAVDHHPFSREVDHFVSCLEDGVESHASIHDSLRSMAVVFAIEESLARGGAPVGVADLERQMLSGDD